jgi:hypothetical protein
MMPNSLLKKVLKFTLPVLFFFVILLNQNALFSIVSFNSYAVDVSQYEKELAEKEQAKKDKEAAMAKLRGDIEGITQSGYSLDYQISLLDQKVADMESQINQAESELQEKERQVAAKQTELDEKQREADTISRDVYKSTRVSVVELFLNQLGNQDMLRNLKYREYLLESQIGNLKILAKEFEVLNAQKKDLLAKKNKLQIDKEVLAESRGAVQSKKQQLLAELAEKNQAQNQVNQDINNLNSQISDLQRQIILLKSGGTTVGTNSVPSNGDYNASLAGFRAQAPAGYFAVFSFGAYTHRNGLSQWGSQARATGAGGNTPQSAEQILQAYFPGSTLRKDYPVGANITVSGYGSMPFETNYLYGINETFDFWHIETLKAQAIISRTYAVLVTDNGYWQICATQQCQVYNPAHNSGAWNAAVDQTKGWVLVDANGTPIHTQFSSTNGGWINNVGWDTTDGSSNGDWAGRAWDSLAGHPWFYRAWYRQSYYNDASDSCGRMPWMSEEEMADILNSYLVDKHIDLKGSVDFGKIYSYTSCGYGNSGAYSMADMRSLLNTPVTSISGTPVVVQGGNGQTQSVNFQTNRGLVSISGSDFKIIFNKRAPNFLGIPQYDFSFINVERN